MNNIEMNALSADAAGSRYKTSKGDNKSLTHYKLSVYKKIDDMIAKYAGQGDMVWVSISDECFQNMQKNPAYESWVMDKIRQACAACEMKGYEYCGVLKFGATEADFQETSQCFEDARTRKMRREQEQEAKEALRRKRKKQLEKKLLEEKWYKQRVERNYVQLKILDHRKQVQEENKAALFGQEFELQDHRATLYATAKRRAAAYESTFLYRDHVQE